MPRNVPNYALLVSVLVAVSSRPAEAQIGVTLNLSPDAQILANALELDVPEFERRLETEVAALYGVLNVDEFLRLSANAQTIVLAGIGADYASNPDGFFLGFGVNAAVNSSNADLSNPDSIDVDREIPISGGATLALMGGYNFSKQGLPWLTLSVHGLYFPISIQQLDGQFTNLGIYAQFKLLRQARNDTKLFYWGGIDITTAFNFARTSLKLTDAYEANTTLEQNIVLQTISRGTLELRQTAFNIPIEITSNVRLLRFLSIYGGFGIDIPFGHASALLDLDTDLVGNTGDIIVDAGTATIEIDDRVGADSILPRFMAGFQFNIWLLKIFFQGSLGTRDNAIGVASGFRCVF